MASTKMRVALSPLPQSIPWGQHGIDQGAARQQAEGVGQSDAVPSMVETIRSRSCKDPRNPLSTRSSAPPAGCRCDQTAPLADGFIKHHEVVGIEILVEQIGTGAIDEHQLAELLQLVLGREGETCTTGAFFSLTLRVLMTKSCSIRASPS